MRQWVFKPAPRRDGTRLTWFQSWLFLTSRERRNTVAVAARRSGKTVGVRARIIDACLNSAAGDVGYMAPTLGQAKRLLWRPLMRDLRDPAAAGFVEGRPNHSELSVEFKTGVRLYLYSAEAYERVRGDGFKLFVTDESDDPLFGDEVFDEAIFPALSDNLGHLIQVGTPKGRSRLFREYRKGQPGEHFDPECRSIQVPAWEAGIIDPKEIERARRTRPKRAFDQEYGATFNAPIGLVYDEWNEERHVVDAHQLPARDELDDVVVGVDWGTAARGAMMVGGIDRIRVPAVDDLDEDEQSRVWLLEEHSESGLAYADRSGDRMGWWGIARQIQRAWRPSVWYYDPAGGSEDATEARAAGLGRQLAEVLHAVDPRVKVLPADNRVGPGIAAVQQHLHYDDLLKEPPRLLVSRACKWAIKEFASYRWAGARGTEDEFEDKPVKSQDHCFVAGTLVTTDKGDVPIEDIRPGMRVLTRDGYYPVKASGMTRESAEVWTLRTSAGHEVKGTANHRIWTDEKGWVRLDSLRYGDTLSVWENTDLVRVSPSTGADISDTLSRTAPNCATTTTTLSVAVGCTKTFGSTTTGPSPMGITFIIATKTPSTTTLGIWSASPVSSTCHCTTQHLSAKFVCGPGSRKFDHSPSSGTEAQRAVSGTRSTLARRTNQGCRCERCATSARPSSTPSLDVSPIGSALTTASLPGVERLASTTLTACASPAGARFGSTSIAERKPVLGFAAVSSVVASHVAPVYDLTVDGPPEFFANSILVHNCMDSVRYLLHSHLYSARRRTRRNDSRMEDRLT